MEHDLGWIDKTVVSSGGDKIGKVIDMHVDANTGKPDWLAVNTGGRFGGTKKRFVPIEAVTREGDSIVVPYDKDMVKNAPAVEAIGVLTDEDGKTLQSYYGISGS
jgi:sporulation protein YlmC with PRC-barrel domain